MRRDVTYGLGGYKPEHPSRNEIRAIDWDDDNLTGTYREWDEDGNLLVERPATDQDVQSWPSFEGAWESPGWEIPPSS